MLFSLKKTYISEQTPSAAWQDYTRILQAFQLVNQLLSMTYRDSWLRAYQTCYTSNVLLNGTSSTGHQSTGVVIFLRSARWQSVSSLEKCSKGGILQKCSQVFTSALARSHTMASEQWCRWASQVWLLHTRHPVYRQHFPHYVWHHPYQLLAWCTCHHRQR